MWQAQVLSLFWWLDRHCTSDLFPFPTFLIVRVRWGECFERKKSKGHLSFDKVVTSVTHHTTYNMTTTMQQMKMGETCYSVEEELSELKEKFKLIEGDRKAYYETSQWTITSNQKMIQNLRNQNKELRKDLASITKHDTYVQRAGGSREDLEEKVISSRNYCNKLYNLVNVRRNKLAKLKDDLSILGRERQQMEANEKESEQAQQLRQLENRLDKANIKFGEAQSIRRTYTKIVKRLEKDRLGYDGQIKELELAIQEKTRECEELEVMSRDAQHARDTAKGELANSESRLSEERKQREKSLQERREQVAQKMEMNEKMEKRQQRLQMNQQDTQETAAQEATDAPPEAEQESKITNYEDALRKIKDATGVSELSEVVEKFMTQGETHKHLMDLKKESDARIQELTLEKCQLKEKYDELKYSGDTKYSGGKRLIDEFESHLLQAKANHDVIVDRFERLNETVIASKAGVEHLSDKLEFLPCQKAAKVSAHESQGLYIVELLAQCDAKLSMLMEGLNAIEVDKEAPLNLNVNILPDLPKHNVRIKLQSKDDGPSTDDEDGDMDEAVLNRDAIKKESLKLLESKTKKARKVKKKRG